MEGPGVEVISWIRDGGIIGLLVLIVLGSVRQWWVPGWHYRQTLQERDEWRNLAMRGTEHTEKSLTVAEEITKVVERRLRP